MRNTASSQLGGAVQLGDAVVPQDPPQPAAERLGQAATVDVEALQVGVEVLPRAVHPVLGVGLLAGRPVAAQLGEVGEHPQHVDLGGDRTQPGRGELGPRGEVAGQGAAARRGGRGRTRAAGCAGRPGRGRAAVVRRGVTVRRQLEVGGRLRRLLGRGRLDVADAAPGAPAARRSRPGCRRTTSSSRTRAANGACSTVSIFMLSSTSTGAPAATSSPTSTGVATTRAGAGERRTPPSSRLTRWVTPSTSTS